jgi:hypothetical protein
LVGNLGRITPVVTRIFGLVVAGLPKAMITHVDISPIYAAGVAGKMEVANLLAFMMS